MTRREINKRIYLTGIKATGYHVKYDMPLAGGMIGVPSTKIGNAIVRALRELAYAEAAGK